MQALLMPGFTNRMTIVSPTMKNSTAAYVCQFCFTRSSLGIVTCPDSSMELMCLIFMERPLSFILRKASKTKARRQWVYNKPISPTRCNFRNQNFGVYTVILPLYNQTHNNNYHAFVVIGRMGEMLYNGSAAGQFSVLVGESLSPTSSVACFVGTPRSRGSLF